MAVKAPWDEFPDLWTKPASQDIFDLLDKAETRKRSQLANDVQARKLEREQRSQDAEDAIGNIVKENRGQKFSELAPKMRDVYLDYGDLASALNLEKQATSESRAETERQRAEEARYLSVLKDVQAIAKHSPTMAKSLYNSYGLANKFGEFPEDFKTESSWDYNGSPSSGIWRVDKNSGDWEILQGPQYKPDSGGNGGEKIQFQEYVDIKDPTKTYEINVKDPNLAEIVASRGLRRNRVIGADSWKTIGDELQAQKKPQNPGGSLLDFFYGDSADNESPEQATLSAPLTPPSPAAVPAPMPTPPQAVKKVKKLIDKSKHPSQM